MAKTTPKKTKKKTTEPQSEETTLEKELNAFEEITDTIDLEELDNTTFEQPIASPHEKIILTKRGLEILNNELTELKSVKRVEISDRIRQARSLGDISENSEYEEAKREQGIIENRILELEQMLQSAIIDEVEVNDFIVRVGTIVSLENLDLKKKEEYRIVSTLEADPLQNMISNLSPFGSALINRKKGEVIRVMSPAGCKRYRILDVKKDS
jgi:transcription elongation factor GreA